MPRVSKKNTKDEILNAYEDLAQKVEGTVLPEIEKPDEVKIKEEEKILHRADNISTEKIYAKAAEFKAAISASISDLIEKLSAEAEKLSDLKRAIEVEKQKLEDTFQIKLKADTLLKLIKLHAQEETEFNEKMTTQKIEWEETQKKHNEEAKQQEEDEKKKRTREEEEYEYNLKQQRKHQDEEDEDKRHQKEKVWLEKIAERERLLAEREKQIKATEDELDDLRKKVSDYPQQLDQASKKAYAEGQKDAVKQATVEKNLLQEQNAGERSVAKLKIEMLEKTIKNQSEEIALLKSRFDETSRQLKEIAVSAVNAGKPAETPSSLQNTPRGQK